MTRATRIGKVGLHAAADKVIGGVDLDPVAAGGRAGAVAAAEAVGGLARTRGFGGGGGSASHHLDRLPLLVKRRRAEQPLSRFEGEDAVFHWTRLLAEIGSSRQTVRAMPPAMRLEPTAPCAVAARRSAAPGLVTRHE